MSIPKNSIKKVARTILILLCTVLFIVPAFFLLIDTPAKVDHGIARLDKIFTGHKADVWGVRFVPGRNWLASCSVDSTVMIRDLQTGRIIYILKHPDGLTNLDVSSDGLLLATSSYDTKIRLWDLQEGKLLRVFEGHTQTPWSVSFHPYGKILASSGADASIRIWDIDKGNLIKTIRGHERTVWDIKFSPDGKTLASGSFDSRVKCWNTSDWSLQQTITGHTQAVAALAFNHKGDVLATASDDATIKLWDLKNGALLRSFEQPEHAQAVSFSPDDTRLLTGGRDKTMMGELLQNFLGDSVMKRGVSARLWDIASGEILQTFSVHANDANDVVYSPDGKWLAMASSDKTVELWQVLK